MPMPTPPKKVPLPPKHANMAEAKFVGQAVRYLEINKQIKPLTEAKEQLSGEIKEYVDGHGVPLPKGNGKAVVIGNLEVSVVVPQSEQVDQAAAVACLTKLGLLDECTTRVLDQSKLMLAYQEGKIDMTDIDTFTKKVPGSPRLSIKQSDA